MTSRNMTWNDDNGSPSGSANAASRLDFSMKERVVIETLTWYLCYSMSDCHQLSSNWGIVMNAKFGSYQPYQDPYSDYMLSQINFQTTIHKAFNSLSIKHQKILASSINNIYDPPALLLRYFHKYTGAALQTELTSIPYLIKICEIMYKKNVPQADQELIKQVNLQAIKDYESAIDTFFCARKRFK